MILQTEDHATLLFYEEFHAYGTSSYRAHDNAVDVSTKRYRYTGMERDEETGLGYHTARYYAPWLARWTAADPIGLGDGVNRYAYAHGNPSTLSDPSGSQSKLEELQAARDRILTALDQLGPASSATRETLVAALTSIDNSARQEIRRQERLAAKIDAFESGTGPELLAQTGGPTDDFPDLDPGLLEGLRAGETRTQEIKGGRGVIAVTGTGSGVNVGRFVEGSAVSSEQLAAQGVGERFIEARKDVENTFNEKIRAGTERGLDPGQVSAALRKEGDEKFKATVSALVALLGGASALSGVSAVANLSRVKPTGQNAPKGKTVSVKDGGSEPPRFTQTTASPTFSAEGTFAGRRISDVVSDLRSGALTPADVPVEIVVRDGNRLVVNTRSFLALRRAGVSESDIRFIDRTGVAEVEARITERLAKNKLTSAGTETLRITGIGKRASLLD